MFEEKKNLDTLIKRVTQTTGLTERALSEKLGYAPGHLAQVRLRGPVSAQLMKRLKEYELKYVAPTALMDIIKLQAETIKNQQNTIDRLLGK